MGLQKNLDRLLDTASGYNEWQRGAHSFFSGTANTSQSKYVTSGHEGDSIFDEEEGEHRLISLVDELHEGYSSLSAGAQKELLANVGCNGCHGMVSAIDKIGGMLQEFNIELKGNLRPSDDGTMTKLAEARSFFMSGVKTQVNAQAVKAEGFSLLLPSVAYAEEDDGGYMTTNMAIEDLAFVTDDPEISYLIAVRDLDSLDTSVMVVPKNTPGEEKLEEDIANLTITYRLEEEFEYDPDYCYVVSNIEWPGRIHNGDS